MTTIRKFRMDDLLKFNNVNLDKLTETYQLPYYMQYLAIWPSLFIVAESTPAKRLAGYLMGKVEGDGANWHGHVTAVTVAPEFRRLGLARSFMGYLETASDDFKAYFVDLYVRASNAVAIGMYEQFGYSKYRRVLGYYSGEEDAFDMRKALSIDTERRSIVPHDPFDVAPDDMS